MESGPNGRVLLRRTGQRILGQMVCGLDDRSGSLPVVVTSECLLQSALSRG